MISHPGSDEQPVAATPLHGATAGAIYLQADASDLLCDVTRDWVRTMMREERRRWSRHARRDAAACGWDVSFAFPAPGVDVLYAWGDIPRHTDPHFPPHSLLFVLRSPGAVVTCPGGPQEPQAAGTLIAFDCHKTHELSYPRKRHEFARLWCAISLDRNTPWTVQDARAAISRLLADATRSVVTATGGELGPGKPSSLPLDREPLT